MNAIRRGLVKLSGHRVVPGDPDEHYAGLTKIGAAILFAAGLAGVNFGLFAWVMFEDGPTPSQRLALTLAFAAVGLLIVLLVDRSMVFFADTATKKGIAALLLFLMLRVALIVSIGTFSSQAVMPLLMRPELEAHALAKRERSDAARAQTLSDRYDLPALEQEEERRAETLKVATASAKTLPADIAQGLAASHACWIDRAVRRKTLLAQGIEVDEVSTRLAGLIAVCRKMENAANQERDRYVAETRLAVSRATQAVHNAAASRDEARSTVKARLQSAEDIELRSITTRSSDVLWSLLRSSPGAAGKWGLLTFLQIILELLPLLLKFNAGQSAIGQQLGVQREIRRLQLHMQVESCRQEHRMLAKVNSLAREATEQLSVSPAAQKVMKEESLHILAALAPLETVNAMMEGIAQQQLKVDGYSRKFPRHARLFADAMSAALQRGAESVTPRGVY